MSIKEQVWGMIMSLIVLFVMIMTIVAKGTSVLDEKEALKNEKKQ